jgi:DNA-3-methyladenine glycosylase I
MAKDLKKAGFKFCGPVICYAFMQAVGMVNDHLASCPRHRACATLARRGE